MIKPKFTNEFVKMLLYKPTLETLLQNAKNLIPENNRELRSQQYDLIVDHLKANPGLTHQAVADCVGLKKEACRLAIIELFDSNILVKTSSVVDKYKVAYWSISPSLYP
jgi:hypothetical protein